MGALSTLGEPRVDQPTNRVTVPVDEGPRAVATAVVALAARGIDVDDIGLRRPSLDEVFLALTGAPAERRDGEEPDAALLEQENEEQCNDGYH